MLDTNRMIQAIALGLICLMLCLPVTAADKSREEQGKEIAFDRKKGNCLACHMIADGSLPGNTAPPLIAMKHRFPEFERLINQIANPLTVNPNSLMPPFGLHNILTDDEIKKVAEYLYTL